MVYSEICLSQKESVTGNFKVFFLVFDAIVNTQLYKQSAKKKFISARSTIDFQTICPKCVYLEKKNIF